MRKHLRFLRELFMPREARFPDEKFWTKHGDPIQAPPKGPPPGSSHTTAQQYAPKRSRIIPGSTRPDLRDHFSRSFEEFRRVVDDAAKRMFGPDWATQIDAAYGRGITGSGRASEKLLRDLWDNNFTDHEALGEVGHFVDSTKRGHTKDYPLRIRPKVDYRYDPDDMGSGEVPRPGRPTGVTRVPSPYDDDRMVDELTFD